MSILRPIIIPRVAPRFIAVRYWSQLGTFKSASAKRKFPKMLIPACWLFILLNKGLRRVLEAVDSCFQWSP